MNDATKTLLTHSFWEPNPGAQAVNALLDAGADVNAEAALGFTPLHHAARHGTAETVLALLDAGADVDAKDGIDFTPLHWATAWGTVETVNELLNANADVTARTKYGDTARDLVRYNPRLDGTDALALLEGLPW